MNSVRKSSSLKKGLAIFLVFSVLAMACILFWTTKKESWIHLLDFRPVFIPILLGLSVIRWFLDGMTLKCMAGTKSQSTLTLERATAIRLEGNMVANVLPIALGIFTAHTYLLHKEKMSWSESTAVSMLRAVLPVILFLGAIPILLLMRTDPNSGRFFEQFIRIISLPVLAAVMIVVSTLFFPRRIKKVASAMVRGCGRVRIIRKEKIPRIEKRLLREIDQFSRILWSYLREKKRLLFGMSFWILITFVADAFIALVILWGMDCQPPFWYAMALLFLLWPIGYLAPVPGGVGVLEFSYLGFFSLYMPQSVTGMAVLLWRLLLTYFPAAVGIFFLIKEFQGDPKLGRLLQGKGKMSNPMESLKGRS